MLGKTGPADGAAGADGRCAAAAAAAACCAQPAALAELAHCFGGQPVAALPPGCWGGMVVRAPARAAKGAFFFGDLRCAMPSEAPRNSGGCGAGAAWGAAAGRCEGEGREVCGGGPQVPDRGCGTAAGWAGGGGAKGGLAGTADAAAARLKGSTGFRRPWARFAFWLAPEVPEVNGTPAAAEPPAPVHRMLMTSPAGARVAAASGLPVATQLTQPAKHYIYEDYLFFFIGNNSAELSLQQYRNKWAAGPLMGKHKLSFCTNATTMKPEMHGAQRKAKKPHWGRSGRSQR